MAQLPGIPGLPNLPIPSVGGAIGVASSVLPNIPVLGPALQGLISLERQAYPIINVNGIDATTDFSACLLNFTYKEGSGNIHMKGTRSTKNNPANTIDFSLADPEGFIRNKYRMSTTQTVTVTLVSNNWNYPGEQIQRQLEDMQIKRVHMSQSKSVGTVIQISCTSMPVTNDIRLTKRSKTYKGTTLKDIATSVCNDNKLTLKYLPQTNPKIAKAAQHTHSDMYLLQKLCSENDMTCRTIGKTVWIRSRDEIEKQAPSFTIYCPTPGNVGGINNRGGVENWSFTESAEDIYSECQVSVKDPTTGKTATGSTTDPKKDKSQPKLYYWQYDHSGVPHPADDATKADGKATVTLTDQPPPVDQTKITPSF